MDNMIPSISMIPPSAREAAKETTEEVMKALDSKMRAFQSLYSQVSCSDMSAMNRISDVCAPLSGGNGGEDARLDWRADPFRSGSDLTLNVYDGGRDDGRPTPYYAHALLLAHGGRKSGFVAEHVRSQRRRARGSGNGNGGGANNNGGGGEGFGRRAHDYMMSRRQNSNVSSDDSSKLGSGGGGPDGGAALEYKVDVHVPSLAARYVPQFLDYVYGSSLKLDTSNAPPLRYLSNRFDCRDLHREITSVFVPRDLNLATAPKYARMADELSDRELRDSALRYMAERFDKIDVENTLGCMDPKLMRRLLQSERLACDGDDRPSEVVARYLRLVDRGATTTTTTTRDDGAVVVGDRAASSADAAAVGRPSMPTSSLSDEDFYWLTHCQIMPRISPREALFYLARGARYPRVMAEVGSGSLRSRCLAAATADAAVADRLSSRLEARAGGGGGVGGDAVIVGSGVPPPPDSADDCCAYYYYETLDPSMKVELLESMMVGARRIMVEGERKYARREGMDREVRMSDEIMYKKSNNGGGGKMVSTTSVSNEDGDGNGGGGGDDDVSKAVVLGCGAGPANGIYISVSAAGRRRSAWDDDEDNDDVPSAGRRRSRRRRHRGGETNDAAVYEREAVWNGKRVAFVLYPVTSGQFYVQYKLGVRHRDDDGGGGGDDDDDDDDDDDEGDGDRRKAAAAAAATRVLYNSPKIVVGDAAVGLGVIIIPDQAWEMEDGDAPEGLRPPPQFVGRVERPVMIASRLKSSLMDSPPERGGWVT